MKRVPMNDREYLILGGSSGIGLAAAQRIARDGGRVILVSSSESKLASALESIGDGKEHLSFCCNLMDLDGITGIFDFLDANGIALDGMVYCAGVSPKQLVSEFDHQMAEDAYRINVLAFIECVKQALQYGSFNEARSGKIVAVGSVTAKASGFSQVVYGSSKAALAAAVKLVAPELRNYNINVNCISPGCVDTDMLRKVYGDAPDYRERVRQIQPLGPIPAGSVAEAISFLLSDTADFITGTDLQFDAGFFL